MTKDTPVKTTATQITRTDADVAMITAHYNVYTVHTIVLVQRSVW